MMRSSPAPSMRAASMISSGTESSAWRTRKVPSALAPEGRTSAPRVCEVPGARAEGQAARAERVHEAGGAEHGEDGHEGDLRGDEEAGEHQRERGAAADE